MRFAWPVYRIAFSYGLFMSYEDVAPLLLAAQFQPCVQELTIFAAGDPYNVLSASLPEIFGLWPNLQVLNLELDEISNVPESLSDMTRLQSLNLSQNRLTSVPDWLCDLTNLHGLILSANPLASVPESLGNLTNLQFLGLSQNQLTSVPESLGNLANLQALDLSYNQLTTVPDSFADLADTLEYLNLENNPISPAEQARIRAMLPNTTITF